MDQGTSTYTLWANVGGWLLAFFLGKKALGDRDKRLDDMEGWQKEHLHDHPNMKELLRMHQENREVNQQILTALQKHQEVHREDFLLINHRLDNLNFKEKK